MLEFLIKWIIYYCFIIFAMCCDNICWVSSSAEWETDTCVIAKNNRAFYGPVKKYSLRMKWDYILEYRILSVLTDIRDIIPAILTSGLMSLSVSL